jgi:hypothetical protein
MECDLMRTFILLILSSFIFTSCANNTSSNSNISSTFKDTVTKDVQLIDKKYQRKENITVEDISNINQIENIAKNQTESEVAVKVTSLVSDALKDDIHNYSQDISRIKELVGDIDLSKSTPPVVNTPSPQKEDHSFDWLQFSNGHDPNSSFTAPSDKKSYSSPQIGMSKSEVESIWGEPDRTSTTTSKYGNSELWIYGYDRYVYFENGHVSYMQVDR